MTVKQVRPEALRQGNSGTGGAVCTAIGERNDEILAETNKRLQSRPSATQMTSFSMPVFRYCFFDIYFSIPTLCADFSTPIFRCRFFDYGFSISIFRSRIFVPIFRCRFFDIDFSIPKFCTDFLYRFFDIDLSIPAFSTPVFRNGFLPYYTRYVSSLTSMASIICGAKKATRGMRAS